MGENKYCYNCMETHDPQRTVCPYCGYDEFSPYNPMYIAPGTILRDRYLIGVLLSYNGEGALYLAFDKVISCKVLIREYMPVNLCTRLKDRPTISVNYNNLAKYKAFMAEYTELNKSLARFRNNANITPMLDMFAENNTTYTVFEYVGGMKLVDYLKENAGELSWEQVSKLFPPLFTTIGILHNSGIVHRAISPETVYINDRGELRLSGFCISAVRTVGAGLEHELYKGYAAPEQYSASTSSRQGSWTDVYSVCALLYRMLTGCMPTDSRTRLENDDLCEPYVLNRNIPQHVSRVIMEGMNLYGRDRIQTITELVTKLFEQPAVPEDNYAPAGYADSYAQDPYNNSGYGDQQYGMNQGYDQYPQNQGYDHQGDQYYNDDYYDNGNNGYEDDDYEEDYRYEKVSAIDKLKVPLIIGILLFAILMIIAVVFFDMLTGDDDDSSADISQPTTVTDNIIEATTENMTEPTTDGSNGIMFELKGKFFETTKEKYKEYFTLQAVYEYNDEYEIDKIFEQSIQAGDPFTVGDTITVKVSKGKKVGTVPSYDNMTISQYETELKKAGISQYTLVVQNSATEGTPNTVLQLQVDGREVKPGEQFDNTVGKMLIVYYLSPDAIIVTTAPPTTEPPTTEPPTETPTEPPTEAPTDPPTEAPTEAPVVEEPQPEADPNQAPPLDVPEYG